MVRDLWYNDALLGGQMVQVLILELLFLWQLTDTFKEQRNLLFPFNLAINNIFFWYIYIYKENKTGTGNLWIFDELPE